MKKSKTTLAENMKPVDALSKSDVRDRIKGTKLRAKDDINPVCLIVGCHRVVKSDGGIEGFHYANVIKNKLLTF